MPKPNERWVCDVIIDEFASRTRHQMVDRLSDADVVWHYAKWVANHHGNVNLGQLGHRPTITTVHHIVPGKPFDVAYFEQFTDVYHVPNAITEKELSGLTNRPIVRLPYWINDGHFRRRPARLTGPKVVIGSFQRDTEGHDLKSPKLEKGPDILADVLRKLDPRKFKVLLGGWRRQYIINELQRMGMEYEYRERVDDISTLYAQCDVYLVTSRYEGGPQALLEAAQVGVRVLSTPVGLAPELLDPGSICGSVDEFVTKLSSGPDLIDENHTRVQDYRLDRLVPRYDQLIESLVRRR